MSFLMRNPYIAGKALAGERGFFGRQDILREVESTLRRSDNNAVVLYGQRRVGKTSILLQLRRRLPAPPFAPIYFDLMGQARLPLNEVLYELAVTAAAAVGAPSPKRGDFQKGRETFHRLFLPAFYKSLEPEQRPVFLLDEFDVLDVADEKETPAVASRTFRSYLWELMNKEPRLAFVFVVGRRMEELSAEFLQTFKAAMASRISVLHPEEARTLILQGEEVGVLKYEEAAIERILALTRGHPYLTQFICWALFDDFTGPSQDGETRIAVEDVESVIPKVLDKAASGLHWIWDGLPAAEKVVYSAIATKAEEGSVLSDEEIAQALQQAGIRPLVRELNLAPQTLVEWQMLEQVNGGYRFYVEMIRRWVAENHPLDKVKDHLDQINPLANSLYESATGYYQRNNNKEAVAQLERAIHENPNHFKAHVLLGTILRQEGHLEKAVSAFEEAYRVDEREGRIELVRTLLKHGKALQQDNRDDAALATYDRALQIAPGEQEAVQMRSEIWNQHGEKALKQKDLESALAAFEEAGSETQVERVRQLIREREIEVKVEVANSHEAEEEWPEAIAIYEALLQEYPDDAGLQERLAKAKDQASLAQQYNEALGALETGKKGEARRHLSQVIAVQPDYKEAARHLLRATSEVDVAELNRQLTVAVEEEQEARAEIEDLQAKLDQLEQKFDAERQEHLSAEVHAKGLQTELDKTKQTLESEQEERIRIETRNESLASELEAAQKRNQRFKRQIAVLQSGAANGRSSQVTGEIGSDFDLGSRLQYYYSIVKPIGKNAFWVVLAGWVLVDFADPLSSMPALYLGLIFAVGLISGVIGSVRAIGLGLIWTQGITRHGEAPAESGEVTVSARVRLILARFPPYIAFIARLLFYGFIPLAVGFYLLSLFRLEQTSFINGLLIAVVGFASGVTAIVKGTGLGVYIAVGGEAEGDRRLPEESPHEEEEADEAGPGLPLRMKVVPLLAGIVTFAGAGGIIYAVLVLVFGFFGLVTESILFDLLPLAAFFLSGMLGGLTYARASDYVKNRMGDRYSGVSSRQAEEADEAGPDLPLWMDIASFLVALLGFVVTGGIVFLGVSVVYVILGLDELDAGSILNTVVLLLLFAGTLVGGVRGGAYTWNYIREWMGDRYLGG